MEQSEMRKILACVRDGTISPEEALVKIREDPFTDLGYAMIDNHRQIRQGFAEVIYGEGKTKQQILGIVRNMRQNGVKTILVTRLSSEKASFLEEGLKSSGIKLQPESDSGDTYTIYFTNNAGWSGTIYCSYWGGSSGNSFPGTAMTLVSGITYKFNVPKDAKYMLFSNGSSAAQTANVPVEGSASYQTNGQQGNGWYNVEKIG